ncbi:MAG: hypothetical protein CL431_04215 [Acidimicrobiaceae bacterium]|jgi:hypothetical protein|nr:hypothetical protein [Acidimicrobiaceae bacterium]|tara:strand:- start:36647 stop:37519 length:873 start_codon:yes stop_codon:yes gene_type:complete
MERISWVLAFRLAWIPIPLFGYGVFDSALSDKSETVQVTIAIGLWVLWSLVLLISLVPSVSLLTLYRVIVPISVVVAIWGSLEAQMATASIFLIFCSTVCSSISLLPSIGYWHINGSSYGDEIRLPLRPPAPLLLGPIPLAWLVLASTIIFPIVFLASERYVSGLITLMVGSGLSYFSYQSLSALSNRWLVFVPAGVVLHDNMILSDPFLVRKSMIKQMGPAFTSTTSTDLTMSSVGMCLEVELHEEVELALQVNPLSLPEVTKVHSFFICPSLLSKTLREASERSIPTL